MKRIIVLLLVLSNLLIIGVTATGDANMDGSGSGGMNGGDTSGSDRSFWNPGDEGVRLTLVDATNGYAVTSSVDYSNKQPNINVYFGKTSKMYYCRISEQVRADTSKYHAYKPEKALPTIISSTAGGNANIDAIRNYFSSEGALKIVATHFNFDYNEMISGKYKLVIEPIAYFTFHNNTYAMTATEAAVYDKMNGGKLRAKMVSLTHKNLPLALFLQKNDLKFTAFGGDATKKQNNDTIIRQLGIGIVSFKETPIVPPVIEEQEEYDYFTDTDVITSMNIYCESAILPEDNKSVQFKIDGQYYNAGSLICPAESPTTIWMKWHTPKEPGDVEIEATLLPNNTPLGNLTVHVTDLEEKEPPDPKFEDKNSNYTLPLLPKWAKEKSNLKTSWYSWMALPLRGGGYKWINVPYTATLELQYTVRPADRVKTERNLGDGLFQMKSGYGIEVTAKVNIKAESHLNSDALQDPPVNEETDLTPVQHMVTVFPEFQYDTYNRFLVPESWIEEDVKENTGEYSLKDTWSFKPNRYSYYKDRVHFTPLWYPDSKEYTVPIAVFDAWTPGGQLYAVVSDKVMINGTIYDDWYIHTIK